MRFASATPHHTSTAAALRPLEHLGAILFAVVLLVVLIALGILFVRRAFHFAVTRRFLRDHSAHYELEPKGERPTDAAAVAASFGKVLSDLQGIRQRRAVISVHRWTDGRTVKLGLTVAGTNRHQQTAAQIARAVGASPRELPTCPLPETAHLAYACRSSFSEVVSLGQDLVDGSVPFETLAVEEGSQLMEAAGPAFLTVSVKPVSTRERDALRQWRSQRIKRAQQLSGSVGTNPWLVSEVLGRGMVVAGSDNASIAAHLTNLGPLLPRYESGLRSHTVSDAGQGGVTGLFLAAAGGALLYFASARGALPVGIGLAASGVAIAGVSFSPRPNVSARFLRAWLRVGVAPIPRRPFLSWIHGYHGGAQRAGTEETMKQAWEWHPYRLVRRALVLTPGHLAAVAALTPSSDTSTGATSSRSVLAPVLVREAHGARLGTDESGAPVYVPDSNRSSGVMVIGDPGQGKSTILLWIFASDLLARLREWRERREQRRAVVWFETKGEGAHRALGVAKRIGYDDRSLCFVDVTAESGPQLGLVDRSDPEGSAEALAEAMRYAFSDRSIMDESEDVLKIVFALALAIPDELLVAAREDPTQGFMSVAFKLLGGDPVTGARERILSQVSQRLGEARVEGSYDADNLAAVGTGRISDEMAGTPLGRAYRAYKSKERKRVSDTEAVFAAPRNKVSKLLAAKSLWRDDPHRLHVSFRQMLRNRMAVVINFGSKDSQAFPDELRARLGAISTYLLWQAIKQECDGWDRKGYSVAIFSDELADISGTGGDPANDVIRLMHDGGRTRGVRPTFATQRLGQLGDETKGAIRSFDTKVYLRLEDYKEAEEAARDLCGADSTSFTEDDVRRQRPLVGIARIRIGDELPPPFTLHVDFDDQITPGQLRSPGVAERQVSEAAIA